MDTKTGERLGALAAERVREALYALEEGDGSPEARVLIAARLLKYTLRRGGYGVPVAEMKGLSHGQTHTALAP